MYKLIYYQRDTNGKLVNGQIVAGYNYATRAACNAQKFRIKNTTHRMGVLKIEKL